MKAIKKGKQVFSNVKTLFWMVAVFTWWPLVVFGLLLFGDPQESE
jgi:hypothetical protein